jgi:hypothetical protein
MDPKANMLTEVGKRREALIENDATLVGDEDLLRQQLDGIEQSLSAGRLPEEEWEQHQMHWLAHCADQMRSIIRRSAHVMLAFEDMERHQPDVFAKDEAVTELLYWWRDNGGREEYLGQITLAERRELEEQERQWRQKDL